MKVSDLAQWYNIDAADCERFLQIRQMPHQKTFAGTVIEDHLVPNYVNAYYQYRNDQQQATVAPAPQQRTAAVHHPAAAATTVSNRLGVLFTINGVRGRTITICNNKCIIKTAVTMGSVLTGNATDGEKVIFYKDCTGLQFKESGMAIGYLQFETPSMQMNNQGSNFFSENTFTFDASSNGTTNPLMREVFYYVLDLMERAKFGTPNDPLPEYPNAIRGFLHQTNQLRG